MLLRPTPADRGRLTTSHKIPDGFVKEVLEQTSLIEIIRPYVQLKKAGSSFVGLCPFHAEKSPSFTVSETKHFYHCFGCGAHGDAIQFLTAYAGLTFKEAVVELAGRLGKPMPTSAADGLLSTPAPSTKAYDHLETAYRFFRHCLKHTEQAKAYLKRRGLVPETLKKFAIGFAPEEWQGLKEAFPDYQNDPLLLDLGLVKEKDNRRYDTFRGRLIFAIKDARGRIIGFGGRSIEDGVQPKYLNSPESAVFDKGSVLFGAHEARQAIRSSKQVIVVEGYMDVVMLAQHGVSNVVASMGTACTPRQIERLCALAPEIVFTFDGDQAGLTAAWRALENCLPFADESHSFRFCLLDGGKDPDDIARTEGKNAFLQKVNSALSLSEFMLRSLAQKMNSLETPEDRARFLSAGMDLIKRLPFGSTLYRIMREEISRAANVSLHSALALGRTITASRARSKDEEFWSHLTEAIKQWPKEAASHLEPIIASLKEDDLADLENERFESQAERIFWETFLAIDEMPCVINQELQQNDESEQASHALNRDLVRDLPDLLRRQLDRARRHKLKEKYRQGIISEEDFVRMRSGSGH